MAQKPVNWLKVKTVVAIPRSAVGDFAPAVVIHGAAHARLALSPGAPVTLLSAPGAALYAGCGWWRALVEQARATDPDVAIADILDCAEGAGQALAALRIGQRFLVLWPAAPGWDAVSAIAAERGGLVLPIAPPALDLAARGAERRLHDWLRTRTRPGDSGPSVG
ncbi:MAG TPA: hypothetical protein VMU81_08735 [Acetobacteraceae bacterium]|jgi:hypothetical protein|nr:hypothetical protein [Acetobacteraceae bacterium]